eukprot:CAMPEP_0196813016 /NCGR_PEP_ID=MMETSP1362-20130617/33016_1 /TAXON_ID=163516 /ORGANISM="Leptocylindrus danicus, Strain CCMP1856" /LENGTH=31 /DNA_ID= /DNA_START= /DNA_END= /DNA_ORIENTATION=
MIATTTGIVRAAGCSSSGSSTSKVARAYPMI